jgi:hypothetical protein
MDWKHLMFRRCASIRSSLEPRDQTSPYDYDEVPAVGAVEVAFVGVVMTVVVDKVGIDRAPAPVTEHPGRLTVEGPGCQQLELLHELDEVGVGGIVVPDEGDEVVLHQLRNVGDRVDHVCNSFPFSVHGRERIRREAPGQGKRTESSGRTGAQRRLGPP